MEVPNPYCKRCGYTHWGKDRCPRELVVNSSLAKMVIDGLSNSAKEWLDKR